MGLLKAKEKGDDDMYTIYVVGNPKEGAKLRGVLRRDGGRVANSYW